MLVVYSSSRQTTPASGEDQRAAKARLATQLLRDAIGKDIYTELVTGEDWTASSESADRILPSCLCVSDDLGICNGRTFLVGEAARKMAPIRTDSLFPISPSFISSLAVSHRFIAGFAENTGIADAYNLLWKILFVLSTKASKTLLESYHSERHPVGLLTLEQAYSRWKSRCANPLQGIPHAQDELPDINIELGFRYNNSKAVVYVGAKGSVSEDPFWPTAFPGGRAPHVWVGRRGLEKSLYMHIEIGRLVLFCSDRGENWISEVNSLVSSLPLKIAVVPLGEFFSKYRIRDNGAVLVRPDGVIAWKALNDFDVKSLRSVINAVLGMESPPEDTLNSNGPTLPVSRANTTPALTNGMKSLRIVDNKESKRMSTMGGLMRRMTTMKGKKALS